MDAKNVRSETVRIEPRKTLGVGEGTVGKVCKRVRGDWVGGRVARLQRGDDGGAADGGEENMETEDPEKKAKRARRIGGFVPREAWHMDRLKHDLTVARSLIEKLNSEKEIPNSPELANALQNNVSINAKSSAEDIAKAIDTCVVYLWNVHGIDYYGGRETNPHDYIEIAEGRNVRAKCSFRKPLSTFALGGGEHAVPADAPIEPIEANEIATKWSKRVDSTWSERLTCLSDPVVLRLVDEADLENKIEEWIKAQVVVFDESRFGSTLSSKLFIAEEFVLKHIKTKQTEAIEKERNRLIDEKYKENVFEYLRARRGEKETNRRCEGSKEAVAVAAEAVEEVAEVVDADVVEGEDRTQT